MAGTVTTYVQPITQPLEGLHSGFTQLASQYRTINTQLRTHANDLLSGSSMSFQGQGAQAFSGLVSYYVDTSEKHMQTFDDAAGAVQTCHSDITMATASAAGAGLNETVVTHVLSQVTHNDIIQRGSEPIWAVINDLLHTLGNMAHQEGSFLGDVFTGNFGGAWNAIKQEWGDLKTLGSDAMGLVQNVGHVLGSWADTISSAVNKCMSVIGSIALKVADFVTGFSSIVSDIKTIFSGKASLLQKLEAAGDLALNVGMDVSMLFGVGEALKGSELLLKGGVDLAGMLGKDGAAALVKKEVGALADEGGHLATDGAALLHDPRIQELAQKISQIHGFKPEEWKTLSIDQRKEVIEKIHDQIAEAYDFPRAEIKYLDLRAGLSGQIVDGGKGMQINNIELAKDNNVDMLDTVIHESYHAHQIDLLKRFRQDPASVLEAERAPAQIWSDNYTMDNYKTAAKDGYEAYYKQPLEAGARDFSEAVLKPLGVISDYWHKF